MSTKMNRVEKMNMKKVEQPASPARRTIMKVLAAGAGAFAGTTVLPEKWMTPIIRGIALPAHARTSDPAPVCTDLLMKQEDRDSFDAELTVSASGQFPTQYAGQILLITFEAYKEAVVTQVRTRVRGLPTVLAEAFSVPTAHAATPACIRAVQSTVAADGSFTAQVRLTCGPGYKQVLAIVTAGATGTTECCRGVLDIAGCNPCSKGKPKPAAPAIPQPPCPPATTVTAVNKVTLSVSNQIEVAYNDGVLLTGNGIYEIQAGARIALGWKQTGTNQLASILGYDTNGALLFGQSENVGKGGWWCAAVNGLQMKIADLTRIRIN